MKFKKNRLGFTLVELVVTTAIMGTLAAIAVPSFIETQAKAKANKTMSNISEIGSKLGQVYNELSGEYGDMTLVDGGSGSSIIESEQQILKETGAGTSPTYQSEDHPSNYRYWGDIFENIPLSPFGDQEYRYDIITPGSIIYHTDPQGNVTVSVIPWQIVIYDLESPWDNAADTLSLSMKFSY